MRDSNHRPLVQAAPTAYSHEGGGPPQDIFGR